MNPTIRTRGQGWAYCAAVLGGVVSVAANVAHSYLPPTDASPGWQPEFGAVAGAVFWPVALALVIEVLVHTSWPDDWRWTTARYVGLLPVALVAAVVSYRHLSGLLAHYREDWMTQTFGPLAVDGLMVMASAALIAAKQPSQTAEPDTTVDTTDEPEADTGSEPDPVMPKPLRRTVKKDRTEAAILRLRQRHPDMTTVEIARRVGVTDRTVRRHLSGLTTAPQQPAEAAEAEPAA